MSGRSFFVVDNIEMAKKPSQAPAVSRPRTRAASKAEATRKSADQSDSSAKSGSPSARAELGSSKVTKPVPTSLAEKTTKSKTRSVKGSSAETSAKEKALSKESGKVIKTRSKGKVVKAPGIELEDLNETALVESKKSKKAAVDSQHIDRKKIAKALTELKKFVQRKDSEKSDGKSKLFEDDLIDNLLIVFAKKGLFSSKKNFKPQLIRLNDDDDAQKLPKRSVAVFVRDGISKEDAEKIEESELKDIIEELIPCSELKTTYKSFEKRRELHSKYDLFLSDDALITSLPKLLGKVFFDSKKIPIPIKINEKKFNIPAVSHQIKEKVLKSVVYQLPRSNNLTINLGSMESVTESMIAAVVNHFSSEQQLMAIYLKANQSPSLPIYEAKTVYSKGDVKKEEERDGSVLKGAEDVELSVFEKGLVELADPDSEMKDLLKSKREKITKKLNKKASKDEGKVTKPKYKKGIKQGKKVIKVIKA